jgi:predicted MFS family arabinose efflux permease
MDRDPEQVTFKAVFAIGEFRALWAAEALSQAGDQLARVALSVLVYERTSSVGLTGLAYGLTYLPTVIGGVVLSGLADRYPRRTVMVVCDVVRTVVAAMMAIPGVPLVQLCGLLVVLTIAGGPFRAAQLAMLPDVLPGERYLTGLAIRSITIQSAQLAGFAGGGIIIAVIGPYTAMAADAGTFALSAVLVLAGVRYRPATDGSRRNRWSPSAGLHAMWQVRGVPVLFGLKMLAAFTVLPEGLAAPYAAELGEGAVAVGLIMASDPIGSVLGAWAYTRWVPAHRKPALPGIMAVCAAVPLAFLALGPSLPFTLTLIALSGVFSTPYQMQATALITRAVPDTVRANVTGLTSTSLVTVQGLGIMAAGGVAQAIGVLPTLGFAAVLSAALALAGAVAWSRATAGQSSMWG